jgi:hypothetical protein
MAKYTYTKAGAALDQLQGEITAAGITVSYLLGSGDQVEVYTPVDLTAGEQITLANVVAAHTPPTALEHLRAQAKRLLDENASEQFKLTRAVVLVAMDEVNLLRQWVTDFKAQVALATSLADLKTRVAGLDNLPQRTAAQAKTAVRNRIDTADAD